MMKIVGLGGSIRSGSYAHQILKIALNHIHIYSDVEVELIDLKTLHLPFCNGQAHYPDYPDVEVLRRQIQSATAILIATPEYHGSLSGVLKNALDLLEEEHIEGKVVGLIAVLGGVHSTNAINTLRLICRHLHCWVLPDQIVIPRAKESFNQKGELIDPVLTDRLNKLVEHLVITARKFSTN